MISALCKQTKSTILWHVTLNHVSLTLKLFVFNSFSIQSKLTFAGFVFHVTRCTFPVNTVTKQGMSVRVIATALSAADCLSSHNGLSNRLASKHSPVHTCHTHFVSNQLLRRLVQVVSFFWGRRLSEPASACDVPIAKSELLDGVEEIQLVLCRPFFGRCVHVQMAVILSDR